MTDPMPAPGADGRVVGPIADVNGSSDGSSDVAGPPGAPAGPRPPRAGELTPAWRFAFGATWVCAAIALGAVWNTSVQLGLSTWWLGPRGAPQPIVVQLVPFVAPIVVVLLTINRVRGLPWIGLAAAAVTAVIGFVDLGRVVGLGVVELVIAGAGAAVSVASFTAVYRVAPDALASTTPDPAPDADTPTA